MDYNENKIQKLGTKLYNLIEINFLWLLFTFSGLFIAGIFPSTSAAFDTFTKYSNDKKINIYQTYVTSYKKMFKSTNIIGYIFSIVLLIITVDYFYFLNTLNIISTIISYILLLLFVLTLFSLLISLKLKTIYTNTPIFDIIKNGIFYSISYFIQLSIVFILIIALLLLMYKIIPGIIPLLAIALIILSINTILQAMIDKKSILTFFNDVKTTMYQ